MEYDEDYCESEFDWACEKALEIILSNAELRMIAADFLKNSDNKKII